MPAQFHQDISKIVKGNRISEVDGNRLAYQFGCNSVSSNLIGRNVIISFPRYAGRAGSIASGWPPQVSLFDEE